MAGTGINPEILSMWSQLQRPSAYVDPNQPPTDIGSILRYISPVTTEETEEGTVYSPGPLVQDFSKLSRDMLFAGPRAQFAVQRAISDLLKRISLTEKGVQVAKRPSAGPTTAQFQQEEAVQAAEAPPVKAVRKPSTTPPAGTKVGKPQFTAPPITTTETPATSTEPPVVPTTTTPTPTAAPIPSEKEIAAGITPWKPRTNFMENITQIINEVLPKWEDLPQAEQKKPSNLLEFFGNAGRLFALNRGLGMNPYEVQRQERADVEKKAAAARDYTIKRAAQVADLKLATLQHQMATEEKTRENKIKFLEWAVKSRPEMMNSLPYTQAVASALGLPPEEAAKVIRESYDPTTGQLRLYTPPEERLEREMKAQWNIAEKGLIEAGVDPGRARYMARGGSKEYMDYMVQSLQAAMQKGDSATARKIATNIREYQTLSNPNIEQIRALEEMRKDPTLSHYDILFTDKATANYFKNVTVAHAMGFKDKVPMPTAPKEIKVAEEIKQEAKAALGNPAKEKAFTDKYKKPPLSVLFLDDATAAELPEPYKTGSIMAPKDVSKSYDSLKAWTEDPQVKGTIYATIINKYKSYFDTLNTYLQAKKQPPLTEAEIYRLATVLNSGDPGRTNFEVDMIFKERKIPLTQGNPKK